MAGQTIGGLFTSQTRGEQALDALHDADFTSAQISEIADHEDAAAPAKLSNPFADFFKDHTTTGSDFRDNLAEIGMTKADADYFEDGVARGGALVTVKADSRSDEALAILRRFGADLGKGQTGTAGVAATGASAGSERMTDDQTMQLKAERLAVDKVRVASGSVRIRKQVVSEQQNIDVPVMHEELVIERRPVSGGAVGGSIGKDETIDVPLSREEVKVSKQTFVTEEIEVGKRAVAGNERISETVKHEELVIDGDDARAKPPVR